MRIKCPHCGEWVNVRLPLEYTGYTATVNCLNCGTPVTVDIQVRAKGAGPKETKNGTRT